MLNIHDELKTSPTSTENIYEKNRLTKQHFEDIDSFSTGHFNYIAKQVVTEVIDNTINEPYEVISILIDDAIDFLRDLRDDAINRYAKLGHNDTKSMYSTLYYDRDWSDSTDAWCALKYNMTAISIGDIEVMMSKYLNVSWSSQTIEWLMMNAYLKQDIYEKSEFFIKNDAPRSRAASVYLAGNSKLAHLLLALFLFHMRFDWAIYILTPISAFLYGLNLLANQHQVPALAVMILTTYITLNFLLGLPEKIISRKRAARKIDKIIDLKKHVCMLTWSPSSLKKRIENTNISETFYPSFIPLLDKMIKRNPNLFNVKGGNNFYQLFPLPKSDEKISV